MPPRSLADRSANPPGRWAAALARFASPAVRATMRRRGGESLGMVLGLVGLALVVALYSHNPADPSLSTATSRAPTNLAGPFGAMASDVLLQGFGWAGWLPAACLLCWALRLGMHQGLKPFAGRVAALLAALPLLAAAAVQLGLPGLSYLPPGGAIGPIVRGGIDGIATGWFGPFGGLAGDIATLVLGLLLALLALGIPLVVWRRTGIAAAKQGVAVGASLGSSLGAGISARAERRRAERRPLWLLRPFRALGGALGGLLSRRREPSVQLRTLLDNAEAAAALPGEVRAAPRAARPPRLRTRPPEPAAESPGEEEAEAPELAPPPRPSRVVAPPPPPVRPAPAVRQAEPEPPRGFHLPPLELLNAPPARKATGPTEEALQNNARLLESVLEDYGVRGRIGEIRPGPVVTLYELEPAPGTKSARVIGLADDIARSMSVTAVRIATVPGRNVIGIEMPNTKRETVYLSELFTSEAWDSTPGRLSLALGKDIGGAPVIADLATMPHLLVAGTTGSGKSVAINTMILSLLYRHGPDECRFIMIDPKMLELSVYDRIPHLLAPVVTEAPKAIGALKWTVREMERRYRALSQLGVRNIAGYNKKVRDARDRGEALTRRVQTGYDPDTGKPVFEDLPLSLEPLPMIVVVIDEMADLMVVAGKEIEASVQRLAQMARAAGIHVIMATQRPSVDVITGVIKANFPARISFQVSSKIDSRTILGEMGAEQLLGQGDMLFMAGVGRMNRVHGPFVSDAEVEAIVEYLREQGEPAYVEEVTEVPDEEEGSPASGSSSSGGEQGLYDQAVDLVSREGKASTSFVQRHLNIGYNRAAKLIEQMEKDGIVGPANHVGKREVLARRSDD
ncbi:DNA translocase FtsK [Roseomonas sp. OT10]|uniref:DNA translocase FtsK n=1 Tax=Roseomonas cutis TaxID=2897332 RepID=UPI001E39D801|nr:DNA translocase FtsK [Roseomonas sp. OT10]UFN48010.1 DNA translocase FtsK [Roseomonas sp. OT10]